jgi:hypothetical protein
MIFCSGTRGNNRVHRLLKQMYPDVQIQDEEATNESVILYRVKHDETSRNWIAYPILGQCIVRNLPPSVVPIPSARYSCVVRIAH